VTRRANSLRKRYTIVIGAAIILLLALNAAVDLFFAYRESLALVGNVQRAEARAAAAKIDAYLGGIESQLRAVVELPWESGLLTVADERDEMRRLLKLVPAISEVTSVDERGRERLFVSRIQIDRLSSGRDFSTNAMWVESQANRTVYGPTFFRESAEPYVTVAVRGTSASKKVWLADVNLTFVSELVQQMRVGGEGYAYIVDRSDRVLAHQNLTLVLRKTDVSQLAQIRQARSSLLETNTKPNDALAQRAGFSTRAAGVEGDNVLTSAVLLPRANWLVFVEQPMSEALQPVRAVLWRSMALLVIGCIVAAIVSTIVSRLLARPILELAASAKRLGKGNFSTRIQQDGDDELRALANEFNLMADQIEDYTSSLEQKVSDKTAQLELANRHKSEFLANMSHELRTPLTAVIGFSDALKEEYFGPLNPKQMEYVTDISASGKHLLLLINDVLDLSKVEAGKMEIDATTFDVASAVHDALILLRERALRQNVTLEPRLAADLGEIDADERKFKQILINLLTNAVKFSYPNGRVRVEAARVKNELVVTVRDQGQGITEVDQQSIFSEFYQGQQNQDAKREGTGLGLALAKRFVELHGGRIWVVSQPGNGAAFSFALPVRRDR
jgi:signal transduction histidine kinase